MASHNSKNHVLGVCMALLLLQGHQFGPVEAFRLHAIRPPSPVRDDLLEPGPPAPARALIKRNAPASGGFRYRKMEDAAHRPTTPGNSPGMGHNTPPGAANRP